MGSSTEAAELLSGYLVAYLRRQRDRRDGTVFQAQEANALVGLTMSRLGPLLPKDRARVAALEFLDRVTRPVLETRGQHEVSVDIAGTAWAEAFGVLPLEVPARAELEWVLERGRAAGAVKGPLGIAWRAHFLAAAQPQLDWRTRRRAAEELRLRKGYLDQKLSGIADRGGAATSAELRLATIASRLVSLVPDADFAATVRRYSDSTLGGLDLPSLPTAQVAQVLLARDALGDDDLAGEALDVMVSRRGASQALLKLGADAQDRHETSPWIPLALVSQGAVADIPRTAAPMAIAPQRPVVVVQQ